MATKRKSPGTPRKAVRRPPRRKTRSALVASILSGAQDYVVAFDRRLRCAFITERTAAELGETPEKLEGKRWERLVHPDLEARWRSDAREVLDHGVTIRAEADLTAGGETRFFEYVASPIPDRRGKPELVLFVSRDVTERRRAEADFQALHRRLQILSEASRTLAGAPSNVAGLMERIAGAVVEAVGDTCGVTLLAEDGETVEYAALRHHDPARQAARPADLRSHPALSPEGVTGEVLATGEPVLRPDEDPAALRARVGAAQAAPPAGESLRTLMGVPLRIDGRVRGAVIAARHAAPPYTRFDLALLADLADRAGLAAARATHFEAERRARREAEASAQREARLQAFTAAISRCSTEEEVVRVGLESAITAAAATSGALHAVSADGGRLELRRAQGLPPEVEQAVADLPLDAARPIGRALLGREALYLESAEEVIAATPELRETADRLPSRSVAALPLLIGERPVGVLGVGFRDPRRFSEEDRHLLEALALLTAGALERVRLIESERRALEHRVFLAEAGELFASTLDEDQIHQRLARQAVPRIADWCGIDTVGPAGELRQAAVAHVDPARIQLATEYRRRYPSNPNQPGGVHEVIRTGKPVIVPVIQEQMLAAVAKDAEHLAQMRALGMRSAMIVPLLVAGRALGAITLVWAETARNYGQEDLRFATELGHRAALAVQNARLYGDLQIAVEARDEFLAMAGHELKTPLTALLLQLQSAAELSGAPAESPAAQRVHKALRSASRLEKLVHQLLDVSRITGARLELDPEPADFVEIVREAVARMSETAQGVGSPIRLDAGGAIEGEWDRIRMDQVITNLLSNALKYGHGEPVDVAVHLQDDGVCLRVRDRGIGIAPDQQTRIFERFERAVTARAYGGLGLGLWISRQIIEAAGGRISVESAPGEGAVFTVWLPRRPPEQAQAAALQ